MAALVSQEYLPQIGFQVSFVSVHAKGQRRPRSTGIEPANRSPFVRVSHSGVSIQVRSQKKMLEDAFDRSEGIRGHGTVVVRDFPDKPLDVNKYATKKTIAQGMLDIALLTANASQLKYILQVGEKHEFYALMLGLITTSLILQVSIGFMLLSLNFMRDCRLHLSEYNTSAIYINYVATGFAVAISAINLLISAFDPSLARFVSSIDVTVGILFLVIGGLDVRKPQEQKICIILNDVILLLVFLISLINVVISSFGMEYSSNRLKLIHGHVSVAALNLLLSRLDIRKFENETLSSTVNHVATGCALLAMVSDVIKMSFGLDPALSLRDFYRVENLTAFRN